MDLSLTKVDCSFDMILGRRGFNRGWVIILWDKDNRGFFHMRGEGTSFEPRCSRMEDFKSTEMPNIFYIKSWV